MRKTDSIESWWGVMAKDLMIHRTECRRLKRTELWAVGHGGVDGEGSQAVVSVSFV